MQGQAPNPHKIYNNWNMCFSCGWDLPAWHDSAHCPPQCRKADHRENCTRDNALAMRASGLNVSMAKNHKKFLPLVPKPGMD